MCKLANLPNSMPDKYLFPDFPDTLKEPAVSALVDYISDHENPQLLEGLEGSDVEKGLEKVLAGIKEQPMAVINKTYYYPDKSNGVYYLYCWYGEGSFYYKTVIMDGDIKRHVALLISDYKDPSKRMVSISLNYVDGNDLIKIMCDQFYPLCLRYDGEFCENDFIEVRFYFQKP